MFDKKMTFPGTFALTCFVWLRLKLPREVVSIMLRKTCFDHDLLNAPPDVNKFYSEICFIRY